MNEVLETEEKSGDNVRPDIPLSTVLLDSPGDVRLGVNSLSLVEPLEGESVAEVKVQGEIKLSDTAWMTLSGTLASSPLDRLRLLRPFRLPPPSLLDRRLPLLLELLRLPALLDRLL